MIINPNFPPSLSIAPSITEKGDVFGVEAQREAISRYGIAGRVWEAAYAMCAYVEHDTLDFDPPFADDPGELLGVIELGSGTGVVAASIARRGGTVIATDLPDVCPLLRHNLGHTFGDASDTVFVRPLAWGHLDHATAIAREFYFAISQVYVCPLAGTLTHKYSQVYFPELLGPLLRTLIHLTSPPCVSSSRAQPKVVISYKIRSLAKEASFWAVFGLWFSFQPILARRRVWRKDETSGTSESWSRFGADEDSDQMFVFVAYRRPESIAWHVPETDAELMAGVGARDTSTKKGDDTFETVLFMAMRVDNTRE